MSRLLQAVTTIVVFCVVLAPLGVVYADPNVDASKTGVLTDDVDSDGFADPGDTITYTVIISNTGNMDATGVSFSDTIDANTSLVGGSVKTTPIALDDIYNVTGNVQISVTAPGVLANDSDPDGGSVDAVPFSGSSTNGGDVELFADGSFTYNPPVGFTGSDDFTYFIEDADSNPDSATVSLSVNDVIWFIDSTATTPFDGRFTSPFNDVAVTTGSFDQNAADGPGDIIFVAEGSYNGGLTLLDSQQLIGDGSSSDLATVAGIALAPDSVSIPAFTGTDPILSTITGDNLTVGTNNTIRGLTIGNSVGTGIFGNTVGTLTVSEASISGPGGAMDITSGVLDVSLDALSASSSTDAGISLIGVSGTFSVADPNGTININGFPGVAISGTGGGVLVTATFASVSSTNSSGGGIRLENLTSGSSFDGGNATVTSSTTDGVFLNNNTGSNFTFADLDVNNFSTTGRGIFASTSGTLNISDGDIDGGTNKGVDIDGTNLNVTLASVTSVGGTAPGIDLNTTTGTLEIIGDGTNSSVGGNASGGTISNKTGSDGSASTGIGVLLNNAAGVTLRRMQLNTFTNFAVRGTNVTGFNLHNSTINGANGSSAAADEGSVRFNNLFGSAAFTESVVSGGFEDNINVTNTSGTLDRLTVTDSTIGLNHATSGNDGILLESQGSAVFNITVTGTTFLGSRGDLLQTNALGTSTMDVVIQDNTFQNAHPGTITGGGGLFVGGGSGSSNINVTYDISGTTAGSQTFRGARGSAITAQFGNGAGTVIGTIQNNAVGVSGSSGSASTEGSGIAVSSAGSVTHTVDVDNNDINGVNGFSGIFARANNSSTLNATITNNMVDEFGGFILSGWYSMVGGATGSDTSTLCVDMRNNTFNTSAVSFTNAAFFDQISASAHYNLPGYGGAAGGGAASTNIATYLTGRGNTLIPGAGVSAVDASLTSGITGTGTTCPLLAALGQGPGGPDLADLTEFELDAIVAEAIGRWSATGLTTGQQRRLARVIFEIVDLPNAQLGNASLNRVSIDTDGAGYGWFADVTSAGDRQFMSFTDSTQLLGAQSSEVCEKMDLLTVVTHELGHVLGRSHSDYQGVMAGTLSTGVRRVPPAKMAEPKTYVDRTKRGSEKVDSIDRAKDHRVLAAPSLRGLPIATSIMAAALGPIGDVELTIGTLPPGTSITITFAVTVNGTIPGGTFDICNQGVVSGTNFNSELTDDPGDVGVDNPTCDSLDVETSDFAIDKDDGQTVAVPGESVTYTIVVTNNGPDDATGATVSDTFPAALSCSWTCTASAGSSCAASGMGNISDSVDLLNGGTATYTAICDISAGATGTLLNTATVAPPADRNDPDTTDNSDSDSDTLTPEADLSLTKTDFPDPVIAGNSVVYTITVENLGPSDASGVVVSDTLPAGVGVVFFETVGCAEDDNGVPTCSLGTLAVGDSVSYTIEVVTTDPTSIGTIMNTATVSSATADPDASNDSHTESTTVLPSNLAPTADANGPYPVDEGGSVQLDGSASSDPENESLTFEWDFDNDSMFDDAVGVSPTFSAASLDGPDTVIVSLRVTDVGGLTDTTTAEIQIANVAPSISATPLSQGVQYSDRIVDVTVDATDVAVDVLSASTTWDVNGGGFVAGLPSGLSLTDDGCMVSGNTQTCTWTLSGIAGVEAGAYTIRVTSQDDDGGSADVDITLNVSPEDATVTFDGSNPVAVPVAAPGGNSGFFELTADVMEFDDPFAVAGDSKLAGDIGLTVVSMTLIPIGPGTPVPSSGACSGVISAGIPDAESAHDYDILTVTCPFDAVPVNAYTLQVDVNVYGFYAGSGEDDVLTVFDPTGGFAKGCGSFFWPGTNDPTTFCINAKYNRRGTAARGTLHLIRRLQDGPILSVKLKSNNVTTLAIGEVGGADPFGWAVFSGTGVFLEHGAPAPIANYGFVVYVEDHGKPGAGADRFWIQVVDPDGVPVPNLFMAEPATTNAETIGAGDILVPHDNGGRKAR